MISSTSDSGWSRLIVSRYHWSESKRGLFSSQATGLTAGQTSIRASFGDVTSDPALLVVIAVTEVRVTPAAATIPAGTTQQFSATAVFTDLSEQVVTAVATWRSSARAIATINGTGRATGRATGQTTITATHKGVTSNGAILSVTILIPPPVRYV